MGCICDYLRVVHAHAAFDHGKDLVQFVVGHHLRSDYVAEIPVDDLNQFNLALRLVHAFEHLIDEVKALLPQRVQKQSACQFIAVLSHQICTDPQT